MRTLTISRDSFYLRFFIWAWSANPEKLNFCKLFWGTLFLPVALLRSAPGYKSIPRLTIFYWLVAVFYVVTGYWLWSLPWLFLAFLFWWMDYLKRRKEPRARGESVWLDRVADFGSRSVATTSNVFHAVQPATKPLAPVLRAVWSIVKTILRVVWWIVSNAILGIPRIIWESVDIDFGRSQRLRKLGWAIGDFFSFVGEGIHAVKQRTCPVVKVS